MNDDWDQELGGEASPLSDAFLNQIVHDAYSINIENIDLSKDFSMLEIYGLDKSLSK